jgi:hypothetical protein
MNLGMNVEKFIAGLPGEPSKEAVNRFFTPEEYFKNPDTDKDNLPENVFGNMPTEEIIALRDKYCPKKPGRPVDKQLDLFEN